MLKEPELMKEYDNDTSVLILILMEHAQRDFYYNNMRKFKLKS